MEVGRFIGDPLHKVSNLRLFAQCIWLRQSGGQLGICEMAVDGAVTDGMNRDRLPASPAFGDRMMPLGAFPQRSLAKPA